MRRPPASRFLVIGLAVIALSACGGETPDKTVPTATTITRSLAAPNRQAYLDVPISADEYQFSPAYTKLGIPNVYTIVFTNEGKKRHALVIEGQGGRVRIGPIEPGETVRTKVDLNEPGEYTIYDPLDGNRAKGMVGGITRGA